MIGVLVISHGIIAETLISEAQSLTGKLQGVQGVSVQPTESPRVIRKRIREKMAEVDEGDGIMILTDIFGGTPTNLSLPFMKNKGVQVITGVNMPMLLALSSYRSGRSLEELSFLLKTSGRRSIIMLRETLGWRKEARCPSQYYYARA
jgi:mannose PTS system EIIA component